ncbi:hypothetical protein MMC22_001425 [Lobaria immixta]|nr:hypothetical protein [Lobaria immixta]
MASLIGIRSSIGSFIPRKQRSANYSANGSRIIEDESSTRSGHNHYNRLSGRGDESGTSVWTHVIGAGAERGGDIIPERDLPMNAISVTKTVDVV